MKSRAYFRKLAEELVSKMTVEECASQLLHEAPAIERLGIKEYDWWNEALHGVARNGIATVFPQAIGMGATFDDEFLYEEAKIISTEGRAKYNIAQEIGDCGKYKGLTFWSPNINIFRDPRWGRGHETYGEDPYLTSRMGVSFIKGMEQRDEDDYLKVSACAKHFAVHSGPEGKRHVFDAKVSNKDLYETYLPAFEACVKEGQVESVMGAYNSVNGAPACANERLLVKILRKEWGFSGHVVSDCWAVKDIYNTHKYVSTPEEAACISVKMGCDLNCGCTYERLIDGYKQNLITEDEIRESAIRVFTTRFSLGIEQGQSTKYDKLNLESLNTEANRKMAYKAACKSTVLLKNDGILPLNPSKISKIAVIGPNARSEKALVGNYNGESDEYITNLDGIRNFARKHKIKVYFGQGCDIVKEKEAWNVKAGKYFSEAIKYAKESDAIVLCLGLDYLLEGEEGENFYESFTDKGDKINLLLPKSQRNLCEKIFALGKPVIVNINAGSALDLSDIESKANALIYSWYSGEEGGHALASILFGEYNPGGRLPLTFYYDTNPIPDFEDYSMKGRTYKFIDYEPYHEFGYGLSYTKFDYSLVSFVKTSRTLKIRLKIKNIGEFDGDEVCQIYSKYHGEMKDKPNVSLVYFKRVNLKKNQEKIINVSIPLDRIKLFTQRGKKVLCKGDYSIFIGGTSRINTEKIKLDFKV